MHYCLKEEERIKRKKQTQTETQRIHIFVLQKLNENTQLWAQEVALLQCHRSSIWGRRVRYFILPNSSTMWREAFQGEQKNQESFNTWIMTVGAWVIQEHTNARDSQAFIIHSFTVTDSNIFYSIPVSFILHRGRLWSILSCNETVSWIDFFKL